jgi:hypothetical protein
MRIACFVGVLLLLCSAAYAVFYSNLLVLQSLVASVPIDTIGIATYSAGFRSAGIRGIE